MANLTFLEKNRFEKLFGMGSGYVLNFTDRTFHECVADSTGLDISDQKYARASGSKANRLRAFWSKEQNHLVGKLLHDLLDYCWAESEIVRSDPAVSNNYAEGGRIAGRFVRDEW